jgi:ankyrin repeat protein
MTTALASFAQSEPTSSVEELAKAITAGDSDLVKKLLNTDAALVHARTAEGLTPLHYATRAANLDMVFMLLSKGADLSAGPESPLLAAAGTKDPITAYEIVGALAGNASNPNARDAEGRTALHRAAAAGHHLVCEFLIHRGANPAARDNSGKTALDVAKGDAVAILRNEAKIERVYFARRYSGVKMPDAPPVPQPTINQFASVSHGDFARAKELLAQHPGLLLARATWDEMGIEAGAHMGNVNIAKFLADAGAPVSICTASVLGMADVVRRLLREDPNVIRDRGAHDLPPLHFAAFAKPEVETAKVLLDAGHPVDSRGFGQTALHVAARNGQLDMAELLLARGADLNARSYQRTAITPLALARRAKQEKMAEFLKTRGAKES